MVNTNEIPAITHSHRGRFLVVLRLAFMAQHKKIERGVEESQNIFV